MKKILDMDKMVERGMRGKYAVFRAPGEIGEPQNIGYQNDWETAGGPEPLEFDPRAFNANLAISVLSEFGKSTLYSLGQQQPNNYQSHVNQIGDIIHHSEFGELEEHVEAITTTYPMLEPELSDFLTAVASDGIVESQDTARKLLEKAGNRDYWEFMGYGVFEADASPRFAASLPR